MRPQSIAAQVLPPPPVTTGPQRLMNRLPKPHLRRLELVATRVTPAEKAWIDALARTEGVSITALVYDMVMPEVKERLARSMNAEVST